MIVALFPLSAMAERPVVLSPSAAILEKLGMGREAEDEVLAVAGSGSAARAVVAARLPMLLEELGAILLDGVPAVEIAREHRRSYGPGFATLSRWNRRMTAIWRRETAPIMAEVAADLGLDWPSELADTADPAGQGTIAKPDDKAARRYWKSCRIRFTQVDGLAARAVARTRAANPSAPPEALEALDQETRVILDALMDEMEPKLVRALATLVPADDLREVAEWCAGPVGEALAAAPLAATEPARERWIKATLAEIRRRPSPPHPAAQP